MTMEQRALGASGVEVSRFILGCGNFGGIGSAPEFFGQGESEQEAHALMDAAWEMGITTFDTADAYGGGRSESYIGSWLAKKGSATRDRVTVTTKLYHSVDGDPSDSGLSPTRIRRCVEASLARLRLEHVPLYMTHQPDPDTPIEETLAALDAEVDRGTVGAFGGCNLSDRELSVAVAASVEEDVRRYEWVQNSYNLFERGDEADVLPFCGEMGLGYTPFGPLAGGWLAGRYTALGQYPSGSRMTLRPEPYGRFENASTFKALDSLAELAAEYGTDTATLSLAWLSDEPNVTGVVLGPRRAEHLEPATRALQLDFDRRAHERLDQITNELAAATA